MPAYQADLIDRLDIDPERKFKEYSKGNKQKIGLVIALQHRPELLDPRRADIRARSARPADVLRGHPRGQGRGPHDLPVEPHPVRGRADVRPGRRSSATAGWSRIGRVEDLRDLAHHQVELRLRGRRARRASSRRSPGVTRSSSRTTRHFGCGCRGSIAPVVAAAARYEVVDFVSREP